MSFSSDVKKELSEITAEKDCCQRAEAYGLLYFGRAFGKSDISIMTDYPFVAEKYRDAVISLINSEPSVMVSKSGKTTVSIENKEDRLAVLNELGYSAAEFSLHILTTNIENECCFGAFLRGAFLSCGIITDPKREYHLEFDIAFKNKTKEFSELFENFTAEPKISSRNGVNIVYFKDSSQIEDILAVMGAQNSFMEVMGEKILKDVRNNVNRKVNCDKANIKKTCNAAMIQISAIEKLMKNGTLDKLPEQLKELSILRINNPEMTLSELGENLSQPLTRSGVNHRLQKLIKLSENS